MTSDPAGIDCGTEHVDGASPDDSQGDCDEDYDGGTMVTLTAEPSPRLACQLGGCVAHPLDISTFDGWGGACAGTSGTVCTLSMDEARHAEATFSP